MFNELITHHTSNYELKIGRISGKFIEICVFHSYAFLFKYVLEAFDRVCHRAPDSTENSEEPQIAL